MKVCIVAASGKLGRYMVQHALDRGDEVVGVCREQSVGKLDAYKGRITVVPGATDDREVVERAVEGCDGVLVVFVPRGDHHYASGTAQAVLDYATPGARLVFSCGWHITRDGQDVYSWKTWATPSSRATSLGVLTSPCSWLRPSETTTPSTKLRRSWAARRRRRSPPPTGGNYQAVASGRVLTPPAPRHRIVGIPKMEVVHVVEPQGQLR